MVKANTFSKIEVTMKDGGKMIWCMEKVNFFFPMADFSIKESGPLINQMDGEFYTLEGKLIELIFGHVMKDRWKMEKCMVEGNCISLMVLFLKGSSKMERCLAADAEPTLMERWSRSSGGWWICRLFWTKMTTVPGYLWDWAQMLEISDDTYFMKNYKLILYQRYLYSIASFCNIHNLIILLCSSMNWRLIPILIASYYYHH